MGLLVERRKGFEEKVKKIGVLVMVVVEKGEKGFRFSHLKAMNKKDLVLVFHDKQFQCIWKRNC